MPDRAARPILAGAAIVLAAVAALAWLGRVPICTCGQVKVWHGVVLSADTSQHLSDWYTFSHIIHGFLFYAMLWMVGRRWTVAMRLVAAIALESGWEVFENTEFVINRYRAVTISLDYYGDSIINSVSDIAAMIGGFLLASRVPIRATVVAALLLEAFVGWAIRDNLTLNILMLVHPVEAIRLWQAG